MEKIPNFELIANPFVHYQLAFSIFIENGFIITDDGTILDADEYIQLGDEVLSHKELIDDGYILHAGKYYAELDSAVENLILNRFSTTIDYKVQRVINRHAGFSQQNDDICLFPVFACEYFEGAYLILLEEDIKGAMYGQLRENLWIIPDSLLKQHFRKEVPKHDVAQVLQMAQEMRELYSIMGTPISCANARAVMLNSFIKTLIKDGEKLIAKAMKRFKPQEVLSTFDGSEKQIEFNGRTYFIYDVTF